MHSILLHTLTLYSVLCAYLHSSSIPKSSIIPSLSLTQPLPFRTRRIFQSSQWRKHHPSHTLVFGRRILVHSPPILKHYGEETWRSLKRPLVCHATHAQDSLSARSGQVLAQYLVHATPHLTIFTDHGPLNGQIRLGYIHMYGVSNARQST